MLELRDVTVCAADTIAPELAARALERCLDHCRFGDAILFSDRLVAGRFRNVTIDPLQSINDYSRFCLEQMPGQIETAFALVVQWDGYVVRPDAWTDEFRGYDYIGAPMDKMGRVMIGNGGFSWRSRKLLDAVGRLPPQPGVPEDWVISYTSRATLEEDYDIRFAPVPLADRFSHEARRLPFPSFGFHSAQNLLRYESEAEVFAILTNAAAGTFVTLSFVLLLMNCFRQKRSALGLALYRQARRYYDAASLTTAMTKAMPPDVATANVAALEAAAGRA